MISIRLLSLGTAITFAAACAQSPREASPNPSPSDTSSATGAVVQPADTATADTTGRTPMTTDTTGMQTDTTNMNRDTTGMYHDTTTMQHDTTMRDTTPP